MREKHNLLVLYLQRQPPTNMAVLLYRYYITGNFRNCRRIYLGPSMKRQKHINHSNIFTKFLKVYNKQSFFIYIICFIFQSIFLVDVKICYTEKYWVSLFVKYCKKFGGNPLKVAFYGLTKI